MTRTNNVFIDFEIVHESDWDRLVGNLRCLPLLLVLCLSGCVTAPAPIPAGYTGPRATITDTSKPVSSVKICFFEITKVDGRKVDCSAEATFRANYGHGFSMDPIVLSREVPAQACVLAIEGVTYVAADILAFGGGMYHVNGEITATLESGKVYFVKGELSKAYSAVWLEDAGGHVVSSKIEKGRRDEPARMAPR